jgi:hypothetical protein
MGAEECTKKRVLHIIGTIRKDNMKTSCQAEPKMS